jgi:hypothetical protein
VEATLWEIEHLTFLKRYYRYNSGIRGHETLRECSPRWARNCSNPAFWPGSKAYATPARHHRG